MDLTDTQKRMLLGFVWLRIGVGTLGLLLPVILVFGGMHFHVPFAASMSAYYHSCQCCPDPAHPQSLPTCPANPCVPGAGPMRDWFVGNLFFIGVAMILIKGFSRLEDVLLDFAGAFAIGVALIYTPWPLPVPRFSLHWFHEPSAFAFFACVALTCEFCSRTTLQHRNPNCVPSNAFFRRSYHVLAVAMVLCPATAWYLGLNPSQNGFWSAHKAFWLEAASIAAFGAYWLFKTWELWSGDTERKALLGEIDFH